MKHLESVDKDAIASLWAEVFHDTDAYIRLFLEKRFSPESFLILREGGELSAMCAFLPAEFRAETGETIPIRYVYALATAPSHRGHGLATRLLGFASAHYGVPLVLVPAEEELEAFYAKLGFERGFRAEEWSVVVDQSPPKVSFRPTDARTVMRRREETFADGHVKWDEEAVSFAIENSSLEGGGALETDHGEIVLYEKTADGDLRIVETTASTERRDAVVASLLARVGAGRAFYRNPGGLIRYPAGYTGPRFVDAYLNLALN